MNPNDQPDQLTSGAGGGDSPDQTPAQRTAARYLSPQTLAAAQPGAGNSAVLRAVQAKRTGANPPNVAEGIFGKVGESLNEFGRPANMVSMALMFPEMLGGFGPHHAAAWEHLAGHGGAALARILDSLGSDAVYALQDSKLGNAVLHGMDLQYLAEAAKNNPFLANWLTRYLSAKQLEHFGVGDTGAPKADNAEENP